AALKRCEAAIAKRKEPVGDQDRRQTAAKGAGCAGGAAGSAGTAQIRAGNADTGEVGRGATTGALGSDVVKDAVIAEGELIYGCRRKDVGLANRHAASVVTDALIAAERA